MGFSPSPALEALASSIREGVGAESVSAHERLKKLQTRTAMALVSADPEAPKVKPERPYYLKAEKELHVQGGELLQFQVGSSPGSSVTLGPLPLALAAVGPSSSGVSLRLPL